MTTDGDIDSIDWSQYPIDRIEGLKYFHKSPSSDEDGPCSDEELKMLCVKWDCRVDMKVDNFLFWLMRKTKAKNYNGNHELFVRDMPKMAAKLRRNGLDRYQKYQEAYGEKNRAYLEHCAEWRKLELRRLRYLDKLRALCSTWSWSDSEDEESDSEDGGSENESTNKSDVDILFFDSDESANTVVDATTRYNTYPETESINRQQTESVQPQTECVDIGMEIDDNVWAEEVIKATLADNIDLDVNTQTFLPTTTSTQI